MGRAEALTREDCLLNLALGGTGCAWKREETRISDRPDDVVHSVTVTRGGDGRRGAAAGGGVRHLVLLHGYGTGGGVFFRNLPGLTQIPGPRGGGETRVHLVDWRGGGLSGRPAFEPSEGDAAREWLVRGVTDDAK